MSVDAIVSAPVAVDHRHGSGGSTLISPSYDTVDRAGGAGGAGGQETGQQRVETPSKFMPPSRRVAIIGYAPSVQKAPWADNDVAIWGLNDQLKTMPRVDVLFEIHAPEVIKAEGHWDLLKQFKGPILMQERYPDIPNAVKYPLDEIGARYQVRGTDVPYLTCSASVMIAFALEMRPAPLEISLYGVDLLMDVEYRNQRPSVEFWLGIAFARGVKVSVQQESGLLKTPYVYGWQDASITAMHAQLDSRKTWLENQIAAAQAEEAQAKEKRLQYVGAMADHAYHTERLSVVK